MQRLKIKYQKYISKIKIFTFCFVILIFTFSFLILSEAHAHCPLCVAGAAGGLTLSRLLGIDDSISGIWIGALIGALAFWSQRILGQRNKIFFKRFLGLLLYTVFLGATIWSFYKFNLIVKHGDIFGFDKLTFGMVLGSIVFYLVDFANGYIKKRNGKSLFAYQSIIFSLGSMILTSIGVYVLINYYI